VLERVRSKASRHRKAEPLNDSQGWRSVPGNRGVEGEGDRCPLDRRERSRSFSNTRVRIPADPEDAYHRYCGTGTPREVSEVTSVR
jgi:hypothetical protein